MMDMVRFRRSFPRAPASTLCTEHGGDRPWTSLVTDLSEMGLRIQRPIGGARPTGPLPLEFEIPEVDEVVWARGQVCFDSVWQVEPTEIGPSGLLRTTGIRLVAMPARHRRMLRDYCHAYAEARLQWENPLLSASCYRWA